MGISTARPVIRPLSLMLAAVLGAAAPLRAQGDTAAVLIRARIEGGGRLSAGGDALVSGDAARHFYRDAGFRPGWSAPGAVLPSAAALAGFIDAIAVDGLEPDDYHARVIHRLLDPRRRLSPGDRAELDLLLTDAFLTAGHDLLAGRVPPRAVHPGWTTAGRSADLPAVLAQALARGRVAEALAGLRPTTAQYARLRQALARYRQIDASGGWPGVSRRTLHPGDTGKEVVSLRTRLDAEGPLPAAADPPRYDSALVDAVQRFQRRHGMQGDGTVGPGTRAALNVSAERRIRQLRASLERERWLPASLGHRYVAVWIPAFELQAVDGGRVVLESRVIGGKSGWHTPIFSATMTTAIFNPYWNIPPSILRGEVLPRQRRDHSYFDREGIEAVRDGGTVRYRQVPGPRNPLGEVKLVFPNPYNVYLHDTSSPSLFQRDERAFSHGCVRVEKPLELAEFALAGTPGWDHDAVHAAARRSSERAVSLADPLPVYILYRTAWVDDDGAVHFRRDLYELDARLERALNSRSPERARPGREKEAEEDMGDGG
ncbi:MAG TPA: L,D-transpeptidase family protein [Longimicrobium sp.]|nr:L,D-transpeptidase family protein [Longimicrobium sp.]